MRSHAPRRARRARFKPSRRHGRDGQRSNQSWSSGCGEFCAFSEETVPSSACTSATRACASMRACSSKASSSSGVAAGAVGWLMVQGSLVERERSAARRRAPVGVWRAMPKVAAGRAALADSAGAVSWVEKVRAPGSETTQLIGEYAWRDQPHVAQACPERLGQRVGDCSGRSSPCVGLGRRGEKL
jgi:hypothetical protein